MNGELAIERRSLAEEVVGSLQKRIASGDFKVGEKLPIEAELMRMFGVGRSTIREAIKVLSNSGLLNVKQGAGTFVASQYATTEPMSHRLKRAPLGDLDEIRQILEMKIAEKAAQKRTKSDMDKISKRLKKIKESNDSKDLAACIDSDIEFHTALAEAAHNEILMEFYRLASEHLRKWYRKIYVDADVFATAFTLHKELCKRIEVRDAKGAWDIAEEIIKHGRV